MESHLRLDVDRAGRLEVTAETLLRGKLTRQRAEQLLGSAGQDASGLLSSGLGLFKPRTLTPEPSLTRIEDGRFLATSSQHIPDLAGFSEQVGPFEISAEDDFRLEVATPEPGAGVSWKIDLQLDGLELQEVSSPPSGLRRDGDEIQLEWDFGAGKAESLDISLDPPGAVEFAAETNRGSLNALRTGAYVLLATLFIPVLLLLLRRGDLGDDRASRRRLHVQVRALALAVGLTLLAVLAGFLKEKAILDTHDYFQWPGAARLAVWMASNLLIVIAAGAIFIAGRPFRGMRAATVGVVLAGIGVVLATALSEVGPVHIADADRFRLLAFFAGATAAAIVVYLVADGVLRTFVYWLRTEEDGELAPPTERRIEVVSLVLVFLLLGTTAVAYRRLSFNLIDEIGPLSGVVVGNAVFSALPLLPLALLPGAARVLSEPRGTGTYLVTARGLWLLALVLYLFFVVTQRGSFVGFSSPGSLVMGALILAGIGACRIVRLEDLDARLAAGRPPQAADGASPLTSHWRELIDRALLIERMQRLRKSEHQKQAKSDEGGEAFLSYRRRLEELDAAESYLQTGRTAVGKVPSRADRELVKLGLPEKPPIIYPALGLGPGRDWRDNGRIAFRYGVRLAILPISYVLFVLIKHDAGSVFDPVYGFELLPVLSLLGSEIALWLVAAYVFGCLFTWLPWGNGALKGFLLSLPVIGGFGLLELCPLYAGPTDWIFRCVEVLAFLSLLGVIMDLRTVRKAGLRERDLGELYQLRSVRFGVVNLAPLLIAALGIYQQIRAGNPQGAVEHALKSAQSQFSEVE